MLHVLVRLQTCRCVVNSLSVSVCLAAYMCRENTKIQATVVEIRDAKHHSLVPLVALPLTRSPFCCCLATLDGRDWHSVLDTSPIQPLLRLFAHTAITFPIQPLLRPFSHHLAHTDTILPITAIISPIQQLLCPYSHYFAHTAIISPIQPLLRPFSHYFAHQSLLRPNSHYFAHD